MKKGMFTQMKRFKEISMIIIVLILTLTSTAGCSKEQKIEKELIERKFPNEYISVVVNEIIRDFSDLTSITVSSNGLVAVNNFLIL